MSTKLVTVATFDQVVQAQMAADALRAAGIDAVVTDAEVVSMDWLLGQAVGGINRLCHNPPVRTLRHVRVALPPGGSCCGYLAHAG